MVNYRRHHYHRSPSATVACWAVGTAVLFFGTAAVSWAVTVLLSKVWPFLLVAMLTAVVFWAVHRLR